MRKSPTKSAIMDRLHKGFVCTCIAVTIYAASEIGWRYYKYFTEVKPKRLMESQRLLAEGSSEAVKDDPELLKS